MRINRYELMRKPGTDENEDVAVKVCGINYQNCKKLNNPNKIAKMLVEVFQVDQLTEEAAFILAFNVKFDLIGVFRYTNGIRNQVGCSPKDIFRKALLVDADNVVIAHNHPNGIAKPSHADIQAHEKLVEVGDILGIRYFDSIIIGGSQYVSFLESEKTEYQLRDIFEEEPDGDFDIYSKDVQHLLNQMASLGDIDWVELEGDKIKAFAMNSKEKPGEGWISSKDYISKMKGEL